MMLEAYTNCWEKRKYQSEKSLVFIKINDFHCRLYFLNNVC